MSISTDIIYLYVQILQYILLSINWATSVPAAQTLQHAKSTALSVFLRLLSEADILEQVPPVLARLLESR